MKRRNFLNTLITANIGIISTGNPAAGLFHKAVRKKTKGSTVSVNDNIISFYLENLAEPIKVIQISDTHLWMDDERGIAFKEYSHRMAGAYNTVKHFRRGENTRPQSSLEEVLELAVEKKADLLALTGDIFSFPSEAAIEWVYKKLIRAGIPYLYIAGNHDWHYEGMEGSSQELRAIWTEKRLKPLYQGNNALMASYMVKGVNFLAIDNSTYEILPEQLEFFRQQAKGDRPAVLMMHIPLYAPGRSVAYGCGHPGWGAKSDRLFEIERRQMWPESGHTSSTMEFHKEVFSGDNIIGVFAGHVHRQSIDIIGGIPQFTPLHNATGAFYEINLIPMP